MMDAHLRLGLHAPHHAGITIPHEDAGMAANAMERNGPDVANAIHQKAWRA